MGAEEDFEELAALAAGPATDLSVEAAAALREITNLRTDVANLLTQLAQRKALS